MGGNAGALQVYDRAGLFSLSPEKAECRDAAQAERAARALLLELHDEARAEGVCIVLQET